MELEEVNTLTCSRCGKQEKLSDYRAKKTHTIVIGVITNDDPRQEWTFTDVCLVCLADLAEWVNPPD